MAQKAVELILMRQLASYLAVPIFLVDPDGNLLYYNEPAERLLGFRYDETGEMPLAQWSTAFAPATPEGVPVPPEDVPLAIAVRKRRAVHRELRIAGLDGVVRRIAVTAFPLEGQGGRYLGAVAIFWEQPPA
jgi:PAS domain S-box-containing protein